MTVTALSARLALRSSVLSFLVRWSPRLQDLVDGFDLKSRGVCEEVEEEGLIY